MAETYGFFDSENHDRPYTSAQMSQYFQGIVTNGVFDGIGKNLVPYINGPYVKIPPGRAVVDCHWYNNDDTVALNFPITSASVRCILVLACDYIQRRIYPEIKQGTSVNLPDITDTENIKYLKLANLQISSSTATVTKVCIGDDTPLLKNLTEYVVKEEGKGLSTNDFTDAYKSQVDTNKSDISALKSKTDATNTEVGKKANSSDVYTKSETDSRITSKVSEIVAGAPEDFDTLKEMSDWLLNHEDNAAAMNTAIGQNTNDISTLKDDVLLQKAVISEHSSAIQENESQITGLDVRLTQAETKVTNSILRIDNVEADVEANTSEISSLRASVDYMSEHKADTTTVTANSNKISALDKRVTANENAISGNASTINALKASVTNLQNADVELSKNIASANQTANVANGKADNLTARVSELEDDITTQSAVNADHIQRIKDNASGVAINKTTLGYQRKNLLSCPSYTKWIGSRTFTWDSEGYMTSADANTAQDNRLWEYGYANRSIYLEAGTYTYSVHIKTAPTTGQNRVVGVDGNNNKLFQVDISDGAEVNFTLIESKTLYLIEKVNNGSVAFMIRSADIIDDTYEPYVKSVKERFDGQALLYNNTSVSDSVLTVNISNLFADYSAVICNIVTSNGRYTQVLPLKYIKSLGTSTYYQAGEMIYYYVDDSNLKIYTGLGQSNPTMTQVQIIGIY